MMLSNHSDKSKFVEDDTKSESYLKRKFDDQLTSFNSFLKKLSDAERKCFLEFVYRDVDKLEDFSADAVSKLKLEDLPITITDSFEVFVNSADDTDTTNSFLKRLRRNLYLETCMKSFNGWWTPTIKDDYVWAIKPCFLQDTPRLLAYHTQTKYSGDLYVFPSTHVAEEVIKRMPEDIKKNWLDEFSKRYT